MIGYIYKITNTLENKHYIGQTVDLKQRFRYHIKNNRTKLSKDINKLGIENFTFDILEKVEKDNKKDLDKILCELETKHINQYDNLYNVQRIVSHQNKWDNSIKKGVTLTELHKLHIKQNANHNDKYDKHGENNPKSKNVYVIDIKTNNIIKVINCAKYAAEELGLNYSTFKKYIHNEPIQINNLIYIYEADFKKSSN